MSIESLTQKDFSTKRCSFHFGSNFENIFEKKSKFRSDPFRKDEATFIQGKEEGNVENTQSIDRIKSIKANINRRDYSNSPDHLESDDPRKGGKVKAENDKDTEDRDNLWTEKLLLNKEAFSI